MRTAAAVATLALAGLAGCGGGAQPSADTDTLVIFSPHSDEIRQEFTEAFQAWHRERTGREAEVSWPDIGGGGTQILKRLQDKFRAGRYDVDLVFGGGPIVEQMKGLGMLQAVRLPPDVMSAVPRAAAGQPLYDPDGWWYGAAISTFGLIYNNAVIRDKGLPPVRDWETLADPNYLGCVGAGDPAKSVSVLKAYEIILQAYGYERGMGILVRMGANAREFYATAGEVPRNCAQGFVAAGPCIDFYAFRQMLAEGGGNLGFLAPPGLTVVTCDPIAVLKGAPHRDAAEQFVEFVMRPEGQRLWMLPAGSPGGPRQYALQRLAVLPAVYDEAAARGAPARVNPLAAPPADFYDAAKEIARQTVLADYLRVALVENHAGLTKAWQKIIAGGLPAAGAAELVRPLVSEEEMLRLGREVWAPLLAPDDAPPEKKAELKRQEEQRQRLRSDTETRWSEALRKRYETLAK
ncbi:MAG: extracellular solute-binding protein [Planctomycetes bacterium]|nr:extracellular solute-binding protein [Planctomycetota bacterium]